MIIFLYFIYFCVIFIHLAAASFYFLLFSNILVLNLTNHYTTRLLLTFPKNLHSTRENSSRMMRSIEDQNAILKSKVEDLKTRMAIVSNSESELKDKLSAINRSLKETVASSGSMQEELSRVSWFWGSHFPCHVVFWRTLSLIYVEIYYWVFKKSGDNVYIVYIWLIPCFSFSR